MRQSSRNSYTVSLLALMAFPLLVLSFTLSPFILTLQPLFHPSLCSPLIMFNSPPVLPRLTSPCVIPLSALCFCLALITPPAQHTTRADSLTLAVSPSPSFSLSPHSNKIHPLGSCSSSCPPNFCQYVHQNL